MGKVKSLEKHYSKWGYIFVIPFVVVFLIFHFWPLGSTVYYAFCYLKHAGNTDPKFLPSIGLPWYKNFAEIFKSKSFWDALKNTLFFWVSQLVPEWIIAFWLAAVMTDRRSKIKGRAIFKFAFFFPKLVAGTALGGSLLVFMISFFASSVGITLAISEIDGFGLTPDNMEFFTSVRFFIIIVSIFLHFGITFIYAIAGITGIPVESFEAAEIDGATRTQTFFRITLPSMKPMLFFITVITVVDGLGMIEVPSYFGSYDLLRRNLTLMMYLENQSFMGSYAYDRAAAASLVLLFIYIIISGSVYYFLLYDKDESRAKRLQKEARKASAE